MTPSRHPLDLPADHPFTLHHLPYGAVSDDPDGTPRLAVRIGDHALDLAGFAAGTPWAGALAQPTLNAFLELGPQAWSGLRSRLTQALQDPARHTEVEPHLRPLAGLKTHLPLA